MGHRSHGCHLLLLLASVSVNPGHSAEVKMFGDLEM